MEDTLLYRYVLRGGAMMAILIPVMILMVGFVIQGTLNLRRSRIAPKDFAARLRAERQRGGIGAARALLATADHSLADVLRSTISHVELKAGVDPIEALEEAIEEEGDALHHQTSHLAIIYRLGPLLGLLGTVMGMIKTFNSFAESATPDVRDLSAGINVAFLSTAWGLLIAIPAYVALYMLQRRITTYETVILPHAADECLHALLDRARPSTAPDAEA